MTELTYTGKPFRRLEHERAMDLELIYKYLAKGWSWGKITIKINRQRRYNLSRNSYYKQYRKVVATQEIVNEAAKDDWVEMFLMNLDYAEIEALEAWQDSKREMKAIEKTVTKGQNGTKTKTKTSKRRRNADIRSLELFVKVNLERMKFLNIGQKTQNTLNLINVSPEALAEIMQAKLLGEKNE